MGRQSKPEAAAPAGKAKKHRFSKAWMHEHLTDHWVQEAQRLGYRARAAFKLIEILDRDRLLRPGMRVVDLGAAPGSWTQVLVQRVGPGGKVVAIDLLPMDPVPGATVVVADFATPEGLAALTAALGGEPPDLVLSDMAPNLSGVETVDQARSLHLSELALEFAAASLAPGGDMIVKMFQGSGTDAFAQQMGRVFERAVVRKPKASRDRSREYYLVGHRRRRGLGAEIL